MQKSLNGIMRVRDASNENHSVTLIILISILLVNRNIQCDHVDIINEIMISREKNPNKNPRQSFLLIFNSKLNVSLCRFTYRQNVLGKRYDTHKFVQVATNNRSTITRNQMDQKQIWGEFNSVTSNSKELSR